MSGWASVAMPRSTSTDRSKGRSASVRSGSSMTTARRASRRSGSSSASPAQIPPSTKARSPGTISIDVNSVVRPRVPPGPEVEQLGLRSTAHLGQRAAHRIALHRTARQDLVVTIRQGQEGRAGTALVVGIGGGGADDPADLEALADVDRLARPVGEVKDVRCDAFARSAAQVQARTDQRVREGQRAYAASDRNADRVSVPTRTEERQAPTVGIADLERQAAVGLLTQAVPGGRGSAPRRRWCCAHEWRRIRRRTWALASRASCARRSWPDRDAASTWRGGLGHRLSPNPRMDPFRGGSTVCGV